MITFWDNLTPFAQDLLLLLTLLAPAIVLGVALLRGYAPWAVLFALVLRSRGAAVVFVALIAVSVGLGVALLAQERALRQGAARAADGFDLIVAAPGSEVTMLLAAVYLQPTDVPLLSGAVYDEIVRDPRVTLAAPIAFGDSYAGAPVVGTIAGFVDHLSGPLAEGRMFADHREAVVGAFVDVAMGDELEPAHGMGIVADLHAHAEEQYVVVGRMASTGSPWDKAILVPIEGVWEVHGLAAGHAEEDHEQLGPPFDPALFPGTPAVLVVADKLVDNYAIRSAFTRDDAMAFFPGAVIANLNSLMGDVRQVMSVMAVVTQGLVMTGIVAGLVILMRLFAGSLALLRAIGAPKRFVFAVVWAYAAGLAVTGAAFGLLLGMAISKVLSGIVTARTDVLVSASLGWSEVHLVAGFVTLCILFALLPAIVTVRSVSVRTIGT
jgi:putative ABC transport system permease protein